ncbi:MAG: bifunctional demethylmenaquinone methyltransferase/2-methoxy-6-polyprenyl-1,4-benzoquinol methylase UbiE [Bacteroidales bacterium]|nr:bifunctional demethylmenaquinone methyltransferase/2-methoxy-6-polyprenyl-1,4-benzoquinol methylase UbiE [Bacteroidales bacterium]
MPEKEKIREMFDSIAEDYDAFNHLTSLGIDKIWRRKALRHIEGPQVLDIACGTGDFAITIAERRHCGVVGVDISEGMLAQMRKKVEAAHLDKRVTCELGDCAALRFKDSTFDNVTVAFGVRNFEDRKACLKEILRVLRPGGKFVMLELGVPRWSLVNKLYRWYFTKLMPIIGGLLSGNHAAYRYLPASVIAFPAPKEWTAFLQACGFTDVKHRSLSLGICRLYTAVKP